MPSPSQVIVLATPVFLALIAVEVAYGLRRARNTYRTADAIGSISLGMLSQVSAVFTRLLRIGLYTIVQGAASIVPQAAGDAFWTTWYGWLLALLFYDFCYYWLHRFGHESAVLWAAHVVHHQSEDYNLSTALRQTSSGVLLGWIFYLPMAVAGVPPAVFAVVALVDLLYQFWVHTEHVPKLGAFDRWFCSPSNHRVHHAVNDAYVDRNYGGILVVWDRLFGTFREEDPAEPCRYGTRKPLRSWDPLWANAEGYAALLSASVHGTRGLDRIAVWLRPPGWRPGEAARVPFDHAALGYYDPPLPRRDAWAALAMSGLLLGAVAAFLWHADGLPTAVAGIWAVAIAAALWAVSAVMQRRIDWLQCVAIQVAAVATATGALGHVELHRIAKPLAMMLVVAWALRARTVRGGAAAVALPAAAPAAPAAPDGTRWLVAALLASLAGDVALMFDGFFVAGLAAFLCAHLAYGVLLARAVRRPPRAAVVASMAAVGAGFFVFLWTNGLPPGLRGPVAAYVVAICAMAALAIEHALATRSRAATLVAAGAVLFVVSDALLATDRFVGALPYARAWVLSTYYAAQLLIASNVLRAGPGRPATSAR